MNDVIKAHIMAFSRIVPGFSNYWRENAEFIESDRDDFTIWGFYIEISSLIIEQLAAGHASYIIELLDYVESVMKNGSKDERDAVATCFLENILNVTPTKIAPKDWIPFLGPESASFCREWDIFTGCRTEFLHDDQSTGS